jgi:hypothetical protein
MTITRNQALHRYIGVASQDSRNIGQRELTRAAVRHWPLVALAIFAANAASAATPGSEPGFSIAPYAWLAGIDGTLGVPAAGLEPDGGNGLVDRIDFSVSDELNTVGFMFYGEWRGDRWMAFFDSVWVNVSQDADVKLGRLLPASDATAEIDGNVYQLALGYRLLDMEWSSLTLYGGARYYDIEAKASARGGILPSKVTSAATRHWTDAVVGARWRYRFGERWHGWLQADYGAGDSDSSWQGFAALGYTLGWGSLETGWRYLKLDYNTDAYRVDLALSGPYLGFSVNF